MNMIIWIYVSALTKKKNICKWKMYNFFFDPICAFILFEIKIGPWWTFIKVSSILLHKTYIGFLQRNSTGKQCPRRLL